MAYASLAGKARTSAKNPQAHAICDRCGGRYNHVDLQFQFDWAGATVQNKRILVCRSCLDTMQPQLRAITLPGDPPPIINARPENYVTAGTTYRVTSGQDTTNAKTGIPVPGGDFRITQNNNNRVPQQTGFADGSLNQQPGTDPAAQTAPLATDPGLPYNNTTVPETGPI
jgi:hypothetical protein